MANFKQTMFIYYFPNKIYLLCFTTIRFLISHIPESLANLRLELKHSVFHKPSHGFLFNCTTVGQASESMTTVTQSFHPRHGACLWLCPLWLNYVVSLIELRAFFLYFITLVNSLFFVTSQFIRLALIVFL